ncbi:MAG: fumarylacetoacetate hydrolase family protein [Tissierellaceae bacterium]|nr:fumarylacetoacetate hydrolase family protein [Tissierellaceae bacterium]
MKFISYEVGGSEEYGILNLDNTKITPMGILLNDMGKELPANLLDYIQKYSHSLNAALFDKMKIFKDMGVSLEDVKVTSPIKYPRRNVFCLGKNYVDHAMEVKSIPSGSAEVPEEPIYFTKIADPAIGQMDEFPIPVDYTNKIDYEVELAVIIGKDGKDILPEQAEDYIFGYTIGNDISARDIQTKHVQWFKGKSLDGFTSLGPYIVDKSEIRFPVELDIICKVNGDIRQNSNTRNLIFDIPTIISDLSKGLTLRAGDIILTGTPAGVGMGFEPPKFLKSGDVVECYVESIGTLVNLAK